MFPPRNLLLIVAALATFSFFSTNASAQETKSITFDDIKFPMEKGDEFNEKMLTDAIRALDGKTITIRGYMQPSVKQKGIKKFIFVRDDKECCYGPGAMLFDCMVVSLTKGTSTEYTIRPLTVTGKFAIDIYDIDGTVLAIYKMTDAKIE